MKVNELIVQLQKKNPNATVLLFCPEAGRTDPYADVDPELRDLPVDGSVVIYPK